MLLLLIACCACSTSSAVTGHATSTAPVMHDDMTLGAATVAAQETIDRFAAGDFASVWEHMAKQVRDGITQSDFVSFYESCKKKGSPIDVAGVRLEGDDEAIVSMVVAGQERSRIMLYEDGDWFMEPTDDFESHLGEPVEQIVAEETADGKCVGH